VGIGELMAMLEVMPTGIATIIGKKGRNWYKVRFDETGDIILIPTNIIDSALSADEPIEDTDTP
jgi:hypothetical protein